ncbi:hypothetical protein Sgly_0599 [Syntrophobotulus glycolicus DSM 8271]|uniref:Flagellar FliJ protein n=2 Tax=Syntrophobotulus TaxID=51196 RepID=F0SZF7_SYNGF|nr:hypothetical protein Sgly_0599 [Syntrophobotulus glycolicus DSM 8271]
MIFQFRLETSLRISKQMMEAAQGVLAEAIRELQKLSEKKSIVNNQYIEVIERQKKACLREPHQLNDWQRFSSRQKKQLDELETLEKEQEITVAKQREEVIRLRVEHEKYNKLKEKQYQAFLREELRKEQKVIDEISQRSAGIKVREVLS